MNNQIRISSYILTVASILFLFYSHLMTSLIGGMVVFLIVKNMHKWLGTKVHSKLAHRITVLAMIVFTVSLLTLFGVAVYSATHTSNQTFVNLGQDFVNILQGLKNYLPPDLINYIPDNLLELKEQITEFLKHNMPNILGATTASMKGFLHVIIGMLIGAIVAFSFLKDEDKNEYGILTKELRERISTFSSVFEKVVFAQVKISAINTGLTAIYLLVVLPIFDIKISYAQTLVLLTFLCGLIPAVGNLVSNTLITIFSLMISFNVAIASLTFLVVVHKLEYYVNAKIVGEQIKTSIWEMLIVMLLLEFSFGIIGLVMAPVLYGYLKEELKAKNLI